MNKMSKDNDFDFQTRSRVDIDYDNSKFWFDDSSKEYFVIQQFKTSKKHNRPKSIWIKILGRESMTVAMLEHYRENDSVVIERVNASQLLWRLSNLDKEKSADKFEQLTDWGYKSDE